MAWLNGHALSTQRKPSPCSNSTTNALALVRPERTSWCKHQGGVENTLICCALFHPCTSRSIGSPATWTWKEVKFRRRSCHMDRFRLGGKMCWVEHRRRARFQWLNSDACHDFWQTSPAARAQKEQRVLSENFSYFGGGWKSSYFFTIFNSYFSSFFLLFKLKTEDLSAPPVWNIDALCIKLKNKYT